MNQQALIQEAEIQWFGPYLFEVYSCRLSGNNGSVVLSSYYRNYPQVEPKHKNELKQG